MFDLASKTRKRPFPRIFRFRGGWSFVQRLPTKARVLDVGCGNRSPEITKNLRPDLFYVGLDIDDYQQTDLSKRKADEYILTSSENFAETIVGLGRESFDAVISSHNLEHCADMFAVLDAMCLVLKPNGRLFLAFPTEASVSMPSRHNTLNYFDDPTHRASPPGWLAVVEALRRNDVDISFASKQYKPALFWFIGLLFEPFVSRQGRQAPRGGTWAYYGFESIIWGVKRGSVQPDPKGLSKDARAPR